LADDAPGNMVSGPKPGAETTELKFVYDAWNRLVKVTDSAGTTTIAE
jgi:YD repeat-containing protein